MNKEFRVMLRLYVSDVDERASDRQLRVDFERMLQRFFSGVPLAKVKLTKFSEIRRRPKKGANDGQR